MNFELTIEDLMTQIENEKTEKKKHDENQQLTDDFIYNENAKDLYMNSNYAVSSIMALNENIYEALLTQIRMANETEENGVSTTSRDVSMSNESSKHLRHVNKSKKRRSASSRSTIKNKAKYHKIFN